MFGIKSAPELFQREMEHLLRGIKGLVVYMDDFMIYGATEAEHDESLNEVLKRLESLNMKINEKKSLLSVEEVTFLGYLVGINGIRPTNEKVQAILNLNPPSNVPELRSLLGLVNFLGKFLPNLSAVTYNMRKLLNKECVFKWEARHSAELDTLKKMLSNIDSLGFFDPQDETILITDASPYGLGAVLIQVSS